MLAAALHHPTKGALRGLVQLEREGARVGGIAEPRLLVRDAWARAVKAGSCFSYFI